MSGARPFVVIALVLAMLPRFAASAAGGPRPLDYKAYDGWNAIATPVISDDGRRLAYALTPEDGDPTLVVRDLDGGAERRELRGAAPVFAANGRFVVYKHVAPKRDVDAAKKAKKPADQLPKDGLGILDLDGGDATIIVERVASFAVAKNGGAVIAYRAEPSPSASASPTPAPSPTSAVAVPSAAASWSPSPSASPSPAPDKSKEPGATLTVEDIATHATFRAPDATQYAVSDDDRWVAYATETRDGRGDGIRLYDAVRGTARDLLTGAGRYRSLAFAPDGSTLAFLSDTASYAGDAPHDALYVVDLRADVPVARRAVDAGTVRVPPHTTPNANGTLHFSRDGRRVFFGTAAAPAPEPSDTPEPLKVDLWSWSDPKLQSQQRHDADTERKRTYAAVYDLQSTRFAQLGSPDLQDVDVNDNPSVALGSDSRPYQRASSWLGEEYDDLYSVALSDGSRRLLERRARDASLSPGGAYALTWDEGMRHWVTLATATGKRVVLAQHAPVRFELEDDDHPEVPRPYGEGGWLAGDRGVLLYDRYDVWLASPATGRAVMLTGGAGRRTHTVYSPVQPDRDAHAFAAGKPILLSLIDERSFASGFAEVSASGGVPRELFKRDEVVNGQRVDGGTNYHNLGRAPLAARHAPRYVFSRETFRMFRDLWSSDSQFGELTQVTNANPQQSDFRWGTERLIGYRSTDGTPLRGILYVPDGLRANRSAPMLVYFYERMSDYMHTYWRPAPGTSPNFMRYVSNGYVVLLADVHYRAGHPGASAVAALMPAVDAAVRTGYVDPARMGIAGHSWAAYQINYLITRVHRFRAAEAGAAVDDMTSAYGGIRLESGIVRESQYEHGQSRIGATPWDRPDLYLENSGLFGIKNVTTPYLTIHNELDGAVPVFQGIEYVTAMRRLGKVAYLFSFDGEEHNLRGREAQKYWTVHLDEWFDYWLKGAPRPAWFDGVPYLQRGERDVRTLFGEGPL